MAGSNGDPFGKQGEPDFVSGSDDKITPQKTDIKDKVDKKDVKFFSLLGVGAVAIIGAGAVLGVMSSKPAENTIQVTGGEISTPAEEDFVEVGPTMEPIPEPVENPYFKEGTPQSIAQQELVNVVFPSLPEGFLDGSEPATEGYNIGSPTVLAYNPEETSALKTAKYMAENLPEGWLEDFSGSCTEIKGVSNLDPGGGTVILRTTAEKTDVCSFIMGTEGGKQVAKVIIISPKGNQIETPEVNETNYESGEVSVDAPDAGTTVFVATPTEEEIAALKAPPSETATN